MKTGIFGYGNLGHGVECAAVGSKDAKLIGIFSRRDGIKSPLGTPVFPASDILSFKDSIDVLFLCGGSSSDLPATTPLLAKDFCTVDSFDTHSEIPHHLNAVDKSAREGGKLSLISGGWDPGLFSLIRLYSDSIFPDGNTYTFWGPGVSQGHSDAVRKINGVIDAREYTIPDKCAFNLVQEGMTANISPYDMHFRRVFVTVSPGADTERIEKEIKEMPFYFKGYRTEVHFISEDEMKRNHSRLSHGGTVLTRGITGIADKNTHSGEFSLTMDSNPEFSGAVLLALGRAVHRKYLRGERGAITVFDVAPIDLYPFSRDAAIKKML